MEGSKTISKMIPDGELNCIWAEAGLVSYKLCDRNYECDECPFDLVMRQKSGPASGSVLPGKSKSAPPKGGGDTPHNQDTLLDVIRKIFSGPFSEKPPGDRMYSRDHVWLKEVAAGTYRIGVDHYAASLLEGVGSVVFPQAGTPSALSGPCAWIICGDGTVAVHSPINGRIRSVNPLLMDSAGIVQSDPYESGWLNEIHSEEDLPADHLDSAAIESLSKDQFQQLKLEILEEFDRRPPTLGVTLMDGGIRPRSLRDVLGPAAYVTFLQKLLSNKPS
jgi:glycine cleavage system H protein